MVQEEIAEEISSKLRLKLTADEKVSPLPEGPSLLDQGMLIKVWAIEYFRQAIEEDPIYALAYVGLSDSYYRLSNLYSPALEAMPKARLAAEKALEIDETLAEAHAAPGEPKRYLDDRWARKMPVRIVS